MKTWLMICKILKKSRVKENIKDMFYLLSQSYGCDVPILCDNITTYQSKKHNYGITLLINFCVLDGFKSGAKAGMLPQWSHKN